MRRFTDSHEWIEICGTEGTVGVTSYAQKELGEIVFIELPEVGKSVAQGEEIVVLESTKAAADIYSPVTGIITAVNDNVKESPSLLNQSPEKEGWIFKVLMTDPKELDDLMTLSDYGKITQLSE